MKISFLALIFSILLLDSCSQYNKVLKGKDMDKKLDMAIELYKRGSYYKALPLLEELTTVFRGTVKAEKTAYYYAYTNYKLEDYQSAAYDFESFTRTYPNSEFAEECGYMHAYCYYQDSPIYSLDQSSTYKAINELQLFTDRYPNSPRVEECNKLIDQLRSKLELKNFEIAELYFNTEYYQAAIVAYKNLLHDFPSTTFREESMFKIVKSEYQLAENSIEEKKIERYEETTKAYTEFISAFPESRLKQKAEEYSLLAQKRLEKINSKTIQTNKK
jgi:outer membrane protein assembly factor BamD